MMQRVLLRSLVAVILGWLSGMLPLVPTYSRWEGSYPEWAPLIGWTLGPLLAAFYLSSSDPVSAWRSACLIEVGLMSSIITDVVLRASIGVPTTVWPIGLVLVAGISVPFVVAGTATGRHRARSA
jgi:hypothetical protein